MYEGKCKNKNSMSLGGKPTDRISKVEKSKVVSFRERLSSTADMATQVMGTSFLTVRPNLFRF